MPYFFLTSKVLFSQVGVTTKYLNSMFFEMIFLNNILMIFKYVLFDDFDVMLLSSLLLVIYFNQALYGPPQISVIGP